MKSLFVLTLTFFVQTAFALDGMAKHDSNIAAIREAFTNGSAPTVESLKLGQYWNCTEYSAFGRSTNRYEITPIKFIHTEGTNYLHTADKRNVLNGYYSFSSGGHLYGWYYYSSGCIADLEISYRMTPNNVLIGELLARVHDICFLQKFVTDHAITAKSYFAMSYTVCTLE